MAYDLEDLKNAHDFNLEKEVKAIRDESEGTNDLDKLNELADKLSSTFGDSIEKTLTLKTIYDKIDDLEEKN